MTREPSTLAELKDAIQALSAAEFAELLEWIAEHDWRRWDREIEFDARSGRLDFFMNEVREEKAQDSLEFL